LYCSVEGRTEEKGRNVDESEGIKGVVGRQNGEK